MKNDGKNKNSTGEKTIKTGKNPRNQSGHFDYLHPDECTDLDGKDDLNKTRLEVQRKADKYIEENKERNSRASR